MQHIIRLKVISDLRDHIAPDVLVVSERKRFQLPRLPSIKILSLGE